MSLLKKCAAWSAATLTLLFGMDSPAIPAVATPNRTALESGCFAEVVFANNKWQMTCTGFCKVVLPPDHPGGIGRVIFVPCQKKMGNDPDYGKYTFCVGCDDVDDNGNAFESACCHPVATQSGKRKLRGGCRGQSGADFCNTGTCEWIETEVDRFTAACQ